MKFKIVLVWLPNPKSVLATTKNSFQKCVCASILLAHNAKNKIAPLKFGKWMVCSFDAHFRRLLPTYNFIFRFIINHFQLQMSFYLRILKVFEMSCPKSAWFLRCESVRSGWIFFSLANRQKHQKFWSLSCGENGIYYIIHFSFGFVLKHFGSNARIKRQ